MMRLNKDEKKALRVSILEAVLLINFIVCTVIFYTIGLPQMAYIIMIGIFPFIILFLSFYPSMDLFTKIHFLSKEEKVNLVVFFLEVIYYIVALFILR